MSDVHVRITIERPVEYVWSLLGGFDWLPRWLDVIASSTLSDGERLRHLKTADGAIIVEHLEALYRTGLERLKAVVESVD